MTRASGDEVVIREVLERYVHERPDVVPDWDGVVALAESSVHGHRSSASSGEGHQSWIPALFRTSRRSRRLLVAALIAVAVVPTLAGALKGWWFLSDGAPKPATDVLVVSNGTWGGRAWTLSAYRTGAGEVCYALTPSSSGSTNDNHGAAMSCAPVGQPSEPRSSSGAAPLSMAAVATAGSADFPGYVVGPVVDAATHVQIRLSGGRAIDRPVVAPPDGLGLHISFFVAELPCNNRPTQLVGLNDSGVEVAHLDLSASTAVPPRPCS
jgi:hypothetical protein